MRRFPAHPFLPLDDGDKLKEECGIFGVYGVESASAMVALGLHALQHRGQESAGIAYHRHGRIDQRLTAFKPRIAASSHSRNRA